MNRNDLDNLIIYLLAIANYAKDIHYNCDGPNFYANHLLADRIQENIYEYIDQIKEICLLGHSIYPLHSSEYLKKASEIIPAGAEWTAMYRLLIDTLEIIEAITGISKGDENLLGAVAQDIQNNAGLLVMMYGDIPLCFAGR